VNRGKVTHPRCGTVFNNSDREGHCAACCRTIVGLRAFDQHRSKGKCLALVDGENQFWLDDTGRWHWGPKMKDSLRTSFEKKKKGDSPAEGAGPAETNGASH